MKLHLPVRLRSALLACCAAVTSLLVTIGSGAYAASGSVDFTLTSGAATTLTSVVPLYSDWTMTFTASVLPATGSNNYGTAIISSEDNPTQATQNLQIYAAVPSNNDGKIAVRANSGSDTGSIPGTELEGTIWKTMTAATSMTFTLTYSLDVKELELLITHDGAEVAQTTFESVTFAEDDKLTQLTTSITADQVTAGWTLPSGTISWEVASPTPPSGTTIDLALTYNGMTGNDGSPNTTREAAITKFAAMADGGYMFNNGAAIADRQPEEGILKQNAEGKAVLALCPRTGVGGSGEAIVVSANEIAGQLVSSFTLGIASSSSETIEGSVALTLAVVHHDGTNWSVYEKAEGSLTIGEGASLDLNLTDVIEEWTTDYKVVAVIDNTNQPTGITAGSNGMPYTLTDNYH